MSRWSGALALPTFALLVLLGTTSHALGQPGPKVKTQSGWVQGVRQGEVEAFKGLPFAAPPVGSLRWRPPQPAPPWEGVRPASEFGPMCMQKPDPVNSGSGPASEDCLTINVFRPPAAGKRLPVLVWIYGGGFWSGAGSGFGAHGEAFARKGLVLVTFNYRVGRLGFFAHPALTRAAGAEPVANYGLMDQIAALRWVQRNIGAFGGDPQHVTVFGESAGAMSVDALMASPEAHGLFQQAISQSDPGRYAPETLAQAEVEGARLAVSLGVTGSDVTALRAIPAEKLIDTPPFDNIAGQGPVIDGKIVRESVSSAFSAGRQAHIPYVNGSTEMEAPAMMLPKAILPRERLDAAARASLIAAYGSDATLKEHFFSDVIFSEPAQDLADLQAKVAPTYRYRFSVLSPSAWKSVTAPFHATDVPYVFDAPQLELWPVTPQDVTLADEINDYWVAFAKTGDPHPPGHPAWPRYDGRKIINFTNAGPIAEDDPWHARLKALQTLYAEGRPPMVWGAQDGAGKPTAAP